MKESKHRDMTAKLLLQWLAADTWNLTFVSLWIFFLCFFFFPIGAVYCWAARTVSKKKNKRNKTSLYIHSVKVELYSVFIAPPPSSPSLACKGRTQSAKSTGGKFQSYTREYIQYIYLYIYFYKVYNCTVFTVSVMQVHHVPQRQAASWVQLQKCRIISPRHRNKETSREWVLKSLGGQREKLRVLIHLKFPWTFTWIEFIQQIKWSLSLKGEPS